MLCKVYRLRNKGDKLPSDQLKAEAGDLCVRVAAIPPFELLVGLRDERGYNIISISDARLLKINEKGLLFAGTEHAYEGGSADLHSVLYRQTWWCVVS